MSKQNETPPSCQRYLVMVEGKGISMGDLAAVHTFPYDYIIDLATWKTSTNNKTWFDIDHVKDLQFKAETENGN